MRNLYNFVKKKIISSKIETYPYPFFLVKNLLPQKEVINQKKLYPVLIKLVKMFFFKVFQKQKNNLTKFK